MELSVKKLVKIYKGEKKAVNNIDVVFKQGVNGLIGMNGAGKTSLMKMLATVMKPTSGVIEYCGRNISKDEALYRSKLGYLPQEFSGYSEITAEKFMHYMGILKNMQKKDIVAETNRLLEFVSLQENRKNKIGTFSGGMKRRLGIAQTLMSNPEIIILDEPTAGLDPKERLKFSNLIAHMAADKIIIISTHIISDIDSIASQIVLMKKGDVLVSGEKSIVVESLIGKVWEFAATQQQIDALYTDSIVANFTRLSDNRISVRMISEQKPYPSAVSVEPILDDVFLRFLGEE